MTKYSIGSKWSTSKSGIVEVIGNLGGDKRVVQFIDTGNKKEVVCGSLRTGHILDIENTKRFKVVGEVFENKKYGRFKVINRVSSNEVAIKFDRTNTVITASIDNVINRSGRITDPYSPVIYNLGYIGIGNYNTTSLFMGVNIYDHWHSVMTRCYNSSHKTYKNYGMNGVCVCREWHNFQNYAEWFVDNYKDIGYHLDKDILSEDKIYSPKTCEFVPHYINTLLLDRKSCRGSYPVGVSFDKERGKYTSGMNVKGRKISFGRFNNVADAFGAYKTRKERHVKEVACNSYYSGEISYNLFRRLMKYEVSK